MNLIEHPPLHPARDRFSSSTPFVLCVLCVLSRLIGAFSDESEGVQTESRRLEFPPMNPLLDPDLIRHALPRLRQSREFRRSPGLQSFPAVLGTHEST